jgi:hypothetical protein
VSERRYLPYSNLYESLYSAVEDDVLVPGDPTASVKWLAWLDRELLDAAAHADLEAEPQILQDVGMTAFCLLSYERGTPGELEFSEEEAHKIIDAFLWGLRSERLRRDGLLERIDDTSIWDDEGRWKLTEAGEENAKMVLQLKEAVDSSLSDSPSE